MIDKFQEITDRIILLLEQGVNPWQQPWNSLKCQNVITGHVYSGWNPIICSIDMCLYGYKHPFFIGFHQARERGLKIKKGSKATWIKFCTVKEKNSDDDSEEEEKESFFISKWVQVFNVGVLEPEDKVEELIRKKQPAPRSEAERIETVEKFIKSHNPKIIYGGYVACYTPATDVIEMPKIEDFHSTEGFYSTLLHELTHWTGHVSRLGRTLQGGKKEYAYEELIAELGAAFLCSKFEISGTIENHASYIKGWLKLLKNDKKAVFNAMKEATKAVEFLESLEQK